MTALRVVAFGVGLGLLSATAHVTITYAGGYTAPQAILTLAIALGVGVAALAIGAAWWSGRSALAGWLLAAIVAGEAFGFIMTSERLIAGRETSQAPIRAAQETRSKASQRVADAVASVASAPTTSAHLEAALAAKSAADAAVVQKSAEHGCATNCRALLQAQVDAAAVEVRGAREEIEAQKAVAESELREARSALAEAKVPASANPLADRLGVSAWIIDLLIAALGSMAANGLGCGLIAFAAHGRQGLPAGPMTATIARLGKKVVIREAEHAAQFAVETLVPSPSGSVDLLAIHKAYREWCISKGVEELSPPQIGAALAALFDGTGITFVQKKGRRLAMGLKIRSPDGERPARTHKESPGAISKSAACLPPKLKIAASSRI